MTAQVLRKVTGPRSLSWLETDRGQEPAQHAQLLGSAVPPAPPSSGPTAVWGALWGGHSGLSHARSTIDSAVRESQAAGGKTWVRAAMPALPVSRQAAFVKMKTEDSGKPHRTRKDRNR